MLNPGTGSVQNFGQSYVCRHIAPLCCTRTMGVEGHREDHERLQVFVRVPIQGRQIYSNI